MKKIFIVLFFTIISTALYAESDVFKSAFEEGIKSAKFYKTTNNKGLRYAQFKSPLAGPKNTIFLMQGRGTFLEFYECLVVPLLQRNFDVWMYDLSGQGKSSRLLKYSDHNEVTKRQMQHVTTFDYYLQDMHEFISNVLLHRSEGTLYLGGYSTGAHLALRYLQKFPENPFEKAFALSPLISLTRKARTYTKTLTVFSILNPLMLLITSDRYAPGASDEDPIFHAPFKGNGYTSDEESYREIQELCRQHKSKVMGGVSDGWLIAAQSSIYDLWGADPIAIPVFIATGGEDSIVDVSYNQEFADKLPKVTHQFYKIGRHEIFRESPEIRAQLWSDLDLFFLYHNH